MGGFKVERGHGMMRHSAEQLQLCARPEAGASQLTRDLEQQLLAAERERVSKDEYAQLHHHTSGMALRKCRQMGQQKLELKARPIALKQQREIRV